MIKLIFSIYDLKARLYSSPFYGVRKEAAQRDFGRAINEPGNELYDNPNDFDLMLVGTFDDETGKIVPLDQLEFVQNGGFLKHFTSE